MNKNGPIIYVEDDEDDVMFFREALESLEIENEVKHYSNGRDALVALYTSPEKPFIIVSDINMPIMSGIELRHNMLKQSDENLRSVPFIFFSTGVKVYSRVNAYEDGVQGYFLKPSDHTDLEERLKKIIDYWKDSE